MQPDFNLRTDRSIQNWSDFHLPERRYPKNFGIKIKWILCVIAIYKTSHFLPDYIRIFSWWIIYSCYRDCYRISWPANTFDLYPNALNRSEINFQWSRLNILLFRRNRLIDRRQSSLRSFGLTRACELCHRIRKQFVSSPRNKHYTKQIITRGLRTERIPLTREEERRKRRC